MGIFTWEILEIWEVVNKGNNNEEIKKDEK